ncbi:MAG: ABC transporter permease [Acidobacteria bacterium]|nr:ABC transporter permease [Acidobacteriota bacterium]
MMPDLRFALRTLARSPLFTTVAVLSLALGIGATSAIFTLLDQLLLRRVPVRNPDNLVMLFQRGPHNGNNSGDRVHSYPIYQDFQTKDSPLAEVICRRLTGASVSLGNNTERVEAEIVSGNYFSMLGVKPALGRVFSSAEDDRTYGGHPSVVLSYDYWRNRFASDRNIIGQKMLVNNHPMIVAGVSAQGFYGLDPSRSPHIRVPVQMKQAMLPDWSFLHMDDRRSRWVQVFARLKPGYTPERAQPRLQVLFRQIRDYEATLPAARNWSAYARGRFLEGTIHVEHAATGYSQLRNRVSTGLVVLMCMVGLVLLIACANVANLLIARAVARQKEIAVRLSIGASRWQLVRQLLVESLTLASAAGVVGIALAYGISRLLLAAVPADGSPLLLRPEPDGRILTFTLAVTVATALLFGLAPAIRASRPDPWVSLRQAAGALAGPGGSLFLRKGLVAVQVALSFLLLFGAGLFVRSLRNLQVMNTGFEEPENLVTFQLSPALNGYDGARAMQLHASLLDQIRAAPGVKSAAMTRVPVLHGWEWDSGMSVEGHAAKDGEDQQQFMNSVSPGYFATMGVKMLDGRDFLQTEIMRDSKAAIVNRRFAEHYFKGRTAIGRYIGFGTRPGTKLDIRIVGVVENTLYEGPREGVRRQVFTPNWGAGGVTYYVRTAMESKSAYGVLRAKVNQLDANMPVHEMKTLQGQLDETLITERLVAMLSAGFGLLATVLAAVGLYGVMAFVVSRRTKELGIRIALGAPRPTVLWMVMREVLLLASIGLAAGVPAAILLGRYVAAQLYGINANDPWTASTAAVLLAIVSGLAGLIPANRASRIDPMIALRPD